MYVYTCSKHAIFCVHTPQYLPLALLDAYKMKAPCRYVDKLGIFSENIGKHTQLLYAAHVRYDAYEAHRKYFASNLLWLSVSFS